MKATTAIFFDKYHPKADGTHSVKVRVTFDRKSLYYQTGISLAETDFTKAMGDKPRGEYKDIALKLQAFENKAASIIADMPVFTFAGFEKLYFSNRGLKDSVSGAFDAYIEKLEEMEQLGTKVTYEYSKKSINDFHAGVKFADITPDFLRKYERWMLGKGKSVTTVGIYLRSLRTIFNLAISDGLIIKEYYPFGKRKYEIPTAVNTKKALTIKDIKAIYSYVPANQPHIEKAKDLWLFLYLCNGMNVKDMCLLKYGNIKGDIIEFERAKTAKTKRVVEPIRVAITEDVERIIKKWGNKRKDSETYLFPILKPKLTAARERQLIQQATHVINDNMKEVAKALELPIGVTTYAARHSFATILQRSGVNTSFISEALGHSNVKTTQNYLAGFEDDSRREIVKALVDF